MRVEHWPMRLAEVIDAAQVKPFGYGTYDCALLAADCVLAITGIDYAAELRGYTSKADAYRIVSEYGSFEAMVTALLKRDPIHPAFACRGDVVLGLPSLMPDEQGESIGICLGARCAFPTSIGLVMADMSAARLAWRIE